MDGANETGVNGARPPETNGATASDRPAPIEWATLTGLDEHDHHDDRTQPHELPLPAWVPPPPGARARLSDFPPPVDPLMQAAAHARGPIAVDVLHRDEDEEPDESGHEDRITDLTLGEVLASRGARFLTLVAVCSIVGLIAASIVLWQRIESVNAQKQPVPTPAVIEEQLRDLRRRISRIETQIQGTFDLTGTVTTAPAPLAFQLEALRTCVNELQQTLDDGRSRFNYC